MPIAGFNHFNLRASRATLDLLRDFYVNVLGLELGNRPPFVSFGYWLYAGTQDILHLTETAPDEHRPTNRRNTFDHAALSCTGLAEFEQRLRENGVEFTKDHVPLTGQIQLFFNDPAGNGVELNFSNGDA
jgi:catechol 2,3-dioxygenase-like lactoylglutathione lyase family enzyme